VSTQPSADDIETIYRRLIRGLGHELVNDDNVAALIKRALQDEHTVLVQELREWQMPCGPGGGLPSTIAPTRGFNKENARH
jgi:hypothetical protein